MPPSLSRLLSGLSNAVKQSSSDSNDNHQSSNSSRSAVIHPNDKYHSPNLNVPSPNAPIKLSIKIESPPILMYGPADDSSGALFSGLLLLDIFPKGEPSQNEQPAELATPHRSSEELSSTVSLSTLTPQQLQSDYVQLKKVSLSLIQIVDFGKPFLPSSNTLQACSDCRRKTVELARWDVLTKPSAFAKGSSHGFPFSHLIPGSIPPTTVLSSANTTIKYELICSATYVPSSNKSKTDTMNIALPIMIRRSILRGQDRNSLRIFPPTEVTATAVIPNVAYPKSVFPVEIRMDNVSSASKRWRMRKLNWRLEESVRVKANSCDPHESKFNTCVEYTKRISKGKKSYKNSGGVGSPMINHFFEPPARYQPNRVPAVETPPAGANGDVPVTTEQPPDLSPFASNWSVGANPEIPPAATGIDDQLSSTMTEQQQQQQDQQRDLDSIPLPPQSPSLYIEEIRTISSGELKSGWKSDFSNKGRIEIVAEISIQNLISMGMNATMSNLSLINSQNCDSPIFDLDYFSNGCNCSCDIQDHELGIYVNHNLIVEVIVAEELMQNTYNNPNLKPVSSASSTTSSATRSPSHHNNHVAASSPSHPMISQSTQPHSPSSVSLTTSISSNGTRTTTNNSASQSTYNDGGTGPDYITGNKSDPANHQTGIPTGVARVLRMQFKLILTERSGLGVAWDDEVPPTYHAVGALSPPTYLETTSEHNTPSLNPMVSPDGLFTGTANGCTPMLSPSVIQLDNEGGMLFPGAGRSEVNDVVLNEPRRPTMARIHEARSGSNSGRGLDAQMNDMRL